VRALVALTALLAVPAFADIIPEEVAVCRGQAAGAACTTPEGHAGTCVETSVTRPDYSGGVPPTYKQVKMLSCVATAKGSARASALPWAGAGLGLLALIAALALRPRPVVRPAS
jgi:hypothetical protein